MAGVGNTRSAFKSFFDAVVSGEPTRADILDAGFKESHVAHVRRQANDVRELKQIGHNAEARRLARGFADDWARRFDADPDWDAPSDSSEPGPDASPAELAEYVKTAGGN